MVRGELEPKTRALFACSCTSHRLTLRAIRRPAQGKRSRSSADSSTDSSSGVGPSKGSSSENTVKAAMIPPDSPCVLPTGGTPGEEEADSGSNSGFNSRAASEDREAIESEAPTIEGNVQKLRRRNYMDDTVVECKAGHLKSTKTVAEVPALTTCASVVSTAEGSKSKGLNSKSSLPWYYSPASSHSV